MSSMGFIDLRLNQHQGSSDDSFWPSFTDIMTVIVMIFLISMLVLLIRNIELIGQLRSSIESERQIAQLVESAAEENDSLADRIHNYEQELSMLRLQLMQQEQQRDEANEQITSLNQQLREKQQLSEQRDEMIAALLQQWNETTVSLTAAESANQSLLQQRDQLERSNSEIQLRITESEQARRATEAQLTGITTEVSQLRQQLTQNLGDYSQLKIKYDRLLRPARTAKGKVVVTVRRGKQEGRITTEYKAPDMSEFTAINDQELNSRLTALKQQYGDKLYVRIIFPEGTTLSYSDAWRFTDELLQRFDYYYQQQ